MEAVLKTIKEIIDAMKADRVKRKDLFTDERDIGAELPKEFRLNMFSAFGCLAFLLVLLIINLFIWVFIKFSD